MAGGGGKKAGRKTREPSETRQRLVETALHMLAEHGVHGVSLNQIVQAAGAKNPSAILYHFGSREDLLRAVLEHIAQLLQPLQQEMLEELEQIEAERELTARDLVAAVHMPVLMLYFSDQAGMHAARLLSRCTWEFGKDGQKMLVEVIGPAITDIFERLQPMMPEVAPGELSLRFLLSISSLFHAVADMDVIQYLPIVGQADARELLADPQKLIDRYLDFQCYGLLGEEP